MKEKIEKLNDDTAVEILRIVARKWLEHRGVEAFVVIDETRRKAGSKYENLPKWIFERSEHASKQLVDISKLTLKTIVDGEDDQSKGWIEEELKDLKQAHAHALDPISLAIVGATIIGIILAARVKKISDVEFFKGVPKEIKDIVNYATRIIFPS
jgi:hypothetical protein